MSMFEFETETLLWMGLLGAVAHVVWLLLSNKFHPLYILAAVFLLVSPFSISTSTFAVLGVLKVIRVYSTVLLVVAGLFMLRGTGLGAASVTFMSFVALFCFGSLWSDRPTTALLYKGLFALLAFGGILLGITLRSFVDLRRAVHVILPAAVIWVVMLLYDMATHFGTIGRLASYDINPNQIAAVCAFYLVICLYIALYDPSRSLRMVSYAAAVSLAIIALFTGSRTGVGAAVLGSSIIFIPLVRRPGVFLLTMSLVAVTGYVASLYVHPESAERLTDLENTRIGEWRFAFERIAESPIIGHGWLSGPSRSLGQIQPIHLHSLYLQIIADVGILGFTLFLVSLGLIGIKLLRARAIAAANSLPTHPIYLAIALLAMALGTGLFESGPVFGTTVATVLWGMAIGLSDSIPRMLTRELDGGPLAAQPPLEVDSAAELQLWSH